jgi:putative transposase
MKPSIGHSALRIGRHSNAGGVYLVTTSTRDRHPWFLDPEPARAAFSTLRQEAEPAGVDLLCSVLMPDHWHGLLMLRDSATLSSAMNRLKSCSTIATNRVIGRSGPLWSKAFHDRAIRQESTLGDVARYIVLNPVLAGLVQRANDYPFWHCIWSESASRPS